MSEAHELVKAALDLPEVIKQFSGIAYKKDGANRVQFNPSPCCNHNDCFKVDTSKQLFNCYSCSSAGDVFSYVEKVGDGSQTYSQDEGESLKFLADMAGIKLPEQPKAKTKKRVDPVEQVYEAAVNYYQLRLRNDAATMDYLTRPKSEGGRGHVLRTIETMQIGLADGQLAKTLLEQGHDEEALKASGLYVEREFDDKKQWQDLFSAGLLVYPHRLESGRVAHFTSKDPSKKRKGWQLHADKRNPDFYWVNQKAKRNDEVHILEGEDDYASFLDVGMNNTIMAVGSISDAQLRWLANHCTGKNVYLWFDNDSMKDGKPSAGMRYVRKVYQTLLPLENVTINVCTHLLDDGEDPDDFVQKDPATARDRIKKLITQSVNPLSWELAVLPAEIKGNGEAVYKYLNDDSIQFFSHLGMLKGIARDAVIGQLEQYGFSRDSILGLVKDTYSLSEQIAHLIENTPKEVRRDEGFMRTVSIMVWEFFNQHGLFTVTTGDNLHLLFNHKLYEVGTGNAWRALLHEQAGINSTTQLAKYVNDELQARCYNTGARIDSFSWIHKNEIDGQPVVFYNLCDDQNRIFRVAPNSVELVPNGTNADKVMLSEGTLMQPFKYIPDVDVRSAMALLKTLVLDNLTCDPNNRWVVLAHGLSPLLMMFTQSRPLMKCEGGSGSGKTTGARLPGYLLYGKDPIGQMTTSSAYEMGGREPILVLDNIENNDLKKDLLNFLLLVSTGATRFKRSGGSDHGVASTTLNSMVTVTAIEPFVKPELINRSFIIQFYKRFRGKDVVIEEVMQSIVAARNEILSAFLHLIANDILPNFNNERREIINYLRKQHGDHSKDRTDEFIAIYVLIVRAFLKYMPNDAELTKNASTRPPEYYLLDHWIGYQNKQAGETERGTNQVLSFFNGIRREIVYAFTMAEQEANSSLLDGDKTFSKVLRTEVFRECATKDAAKKYSIEGTANDLLNFFHLVAKENGIRSVPFENTKQLSARMRDQREVLHADGWAWDKIKVVNGIQVWRYTWTEHLDD